MQLRLRVMGIGAALCATFWGAACDESTGLGVAKPKMVVEPVSGTTLDFGEVVLGRDAAPMLQIEIRNEGETSLQLSSVSFVGPDAASFEVNFTRQNIFAGARETLFLRFKPTSIGAKFAELQIASNDSELPLAVFPVTGSAREACQLVAEPSSLNFNLGEVQTARLFSETSEPCIVTRVNGLEGEFRFVETPAFPLVASRDVPLELPIQQVEPITEAGLPTRLAVFYEADGGSYPLYLSGEPPLFGCLSVFPIRLRFPTSDYNEPVRASVKVQNHCAKEALITSAVIATGYNLFGMDEGAVYPMVVPPLGEQDVWVTYYPFSFADVGSLAINTNDAANPRFKVELRGEAKSPIVHIFPVRLDFGSVAWKTGPGSVVSECQSGQRTVNISNSGNGSLLVNRITVTGSDRQFEVSRVEVGEQSLSNWQNGFVVPPQSAATIHLRFSPSRLGQHDAQLSIEHAASTQPFITQLTGLGATEGQVEDRFQQLEGPKVDILWVIDDSCSMIDEQDRLIANLSQFVAYADSLDSDYQMAVTVTNSRGRSAGRMRRCYPHPSIISSAYNPDPNAQDGGAAARAEAFECMFQVGNMGVFIESGLGASMRALELAQMGGDPNRNPNAGFLRDDANLAIVIMSDEEDQSAETDQTIYDYLLSIKGVHRPNRLSLHAIAGPVFEDCEIGGIRAADPGYRYYAATQRLGGLFQSICDADWQPTLRNLGLNVFTPLDEWDLSQIADPETLSVTVAGRPIARDSSNGYSFNIEANSVRLHGESLPQPGEEVVVRYTGLCEP